MKLIKTEDGLHTIFSTKYNETYHSKHGVLQEAHHVFINGADVSKKIKTQKKITILEIGFGTGFNFFLSAAEALKQQTELDYFAVEKELLSYNDFIGLNHDREFSQNPVWENFLAWRKLSSNLRPGIYKIVFKSIVLFLIYTNALKMTLPKDRFDAVYHDAFSPDVNPELWTSSFFQQIKESMKRGSKLSTYSAKSSVKRTLLDAGFSVEKLSGAKGKREMLLASKI